MLPLVVDLPDELTLLSECRLAYILALRDPARVRLLSGYRLLCSCVTRTVK